MDKMNVRFSLHVTCLKGVNCDYLQLTSHIFIMVKLVVRTVKFCPEWLVLQCTILPCLSVEHKDCVKITSTL